MRCRHLPDRLLMTDERMGDALWDALERLPRRAGVVFRHYGLAPAERRALFEKVRRKARRKRLVLLLGGSPRLAAAWRADGVHGRSPHRLSTRPLLWSAPCHDRAELIAARRLGRDLVLVSPVFATRSHPSARPLGSVRLGLVLGDKRSDVVALGGMDARLAASLRALGITRWAAIDAWSNPRQKRKAVPT